MFSSEGRTRCALFFAKPLLFDSSRQEADPKRGLEILRRRKVSLKTVVLGLSVVGGILVVWGTGGLFFEGQRHLAMALFGLWLVAIGLTLELMQFLEEEVIGEGP